MSKGSDAKTKELLLQTKQCCSTDTINTLAEENKEGFQKLEPGPMLHVGTPIGAIRTQDIHNWKLPPNVKRILTPMNNPVIHQK